VFHGQGIGNHNRLLGSVEGVDGIKTGYTRASGFNLLTSVKRDGRQLVAVVMGGRTGASRDNTMRQLIASNLPRAYAGARQTTMMAQAPAAADAPGSDSPTAVLLADAQKKATAQPVKLAALDPAPAKPRARPAVVAEVAKPLAAAPAAEPVRLASADVEAKPRARPIVVGKPAVEPAEPAGPAMRWVAGPAPLTEPASKPVKTAEAVSDSPEATASVPVRTTAIVVDTGTGTVLHDTEARNAEPVAKATAGKAVAVKATAEPEDAEGTTVAVANSNRTGWVIQIGATDSQGAARSLLDRARSSSQRMLASAEPFTESVEKNGSTLWRARFGGFDDQKGAQAACTALKTKSFACMAMRL
jgi:D-alanyl-D-alanine carboxypeptidase